MTRRTNNPWLHRLAVLTAAATLFLICVGGMVTSKGVGLAVPDWPTTYGENMFLFPFSKWVGGVFYEHSHRLVASAVGFLTTILAVWLWLKEQRKWLRWLGVLAFAAVVAQGVLGGLRVTELRDELGIFHAALAQLFFVLLCAIALFTSRWWIHKAASGFGVLPLGSPDRLKAELPTIYVAATCLIFVQLVIGATMRHQHAGLAIPDFPLAYGELWPATDLDSIARYNQMRMESTAAHPITASGVVLQMVHRILAFAILFSVVFAAGKTLRRFTAYSVPGKLAIAWLALIMIQVGLGAATIWTDKSADIATAHVAVGALSLAAGSMLVLTAPRCFADSRAFAERVVPQPEPIGVTV
jgi:cytochrome c oxidase assembly protein subunit 15